MFERFADRFWFGNGEEINVTPALAPGELLSKSSVASPFALSGGLRRILSKPIDEAQAKQSPINRMDALDQIIAFKRGLLRQAEAFLAMT